MGSSTARFEADTPGGRVWVVLEGPEAAPAVVALAHGAGADMTSEFMATTAAGLVAAGLRVCRFNFPYAELGRKRPDREDVLEATWWEVAGRMRAVAPGARLVLGGKSMGGRVAAQAVAAGVDADGLVLLGYPLHPPGRPEKLRAEPLRAARVPMLFVEGTRDPFCPLETLKHVLSGVPDAEVAVIEGGDHSFKVRASSGRSTPQAWSEVVDAVTPWVHRIAEGERRRRDGYTATNEGVD